jgi:hypothetical protein
MSTEQKEKGFVERCLEDIENNPQLYDALGGDGDYEPEKEYDYRPSTSSK